MPGPMNPYEDPHIEEMRRRDRHSAAIGALLGLVAAAFAVGAAFLVLRHPPIYSVTINGTREMIHTGYTVRDAVNDGHAAPKPGDLMAIDGSVLQEGAGEAMTVIVNGVEATPDTRLESGDDVSIGDGRDKTEEVEERTEKVPCGKADTAMDAASYYIGSIHTYSKGQDGERVTRVGRISGKKEVTDTKKAVPAGYSSRTVKVADGSKKIALTFDDGPWPGTTEEILDILRENDAHATFFTIGNQVSDNASAVRRAYDEGNQIATHTWDHASGSGEGVNITYMTAQEQRDEVTKGFAAVEKATGKKPERVFRAPGGNYYGDAITNLADIVDVEIGWDVDTEDWSRPGADVICQRIESVQPGQVILCHDGGGDRSQTVEALRTAIPELRRQGYEFVTIDELLASEKA